MEQILIKPLFPHLDRFLAKLKPSDTRSEFIDGRGYQKPIPQGTTIHLQTQLWDAINTVTPIPQQAIAYPNYRCSFGSWSLVPTLAVFFKPPLAVNADAILPLSYYGNADERRSPHHSALMPGCGRCPDWVIEMILPEQQSIQPLRSVLHCLSYGTQMAWLIDPDQRLIFVFQADATPCEFKQNQILPVPDQLDLTLRVEQVLGWIPAKP